MRRMIDAIVRCAWSSLVGHNGLNRSMIGAVLATVLGACPMAHAQSGTTLILGAMKDNTLYESATGSVSNGAGDYFFAGVTAITGGAALRRGLLAFDIAGFVPAGSTITNVELTLQMTRTIAGALTVSLHHVQQDWGEGASNAAGQEGGGTTALPGDATWKHTFFDAALWQTLGGDFDVITSASQQVAGLGSYTWGSTIELVSDVQGWLDAPSTNFGWVVIGAEQVIGSAKRFASRENLNASFQPGLSVTYTPPVFCQGDADGDGMVNFTDITSVLGNWLVDYTPGTGPGDANGDGIVNFMDITEVLSNWLGVCP